MTKVSVVIPVYNTEKYLEKCLESVTRQTIDSLEVVIVDDGSTDSSPTIIDAFQRKYPEMIKTVRQENAGQGKARNVGIRMCSGEYIGFVDSDDLIEINMYEGMYSLAKKTNSDMVECNYAFLDEQENKLRQYGYVRKYTNKKDMFFNPLVSPWNKLYRADILKGENASGKQIMFPEGYIYEDTSFFLKTIPEINKYEFIDKEFVKHYLRAGSTMNINKSKRVGNFFAVLEDTVLYYKENGLFPEYSTDLEYCCVHLLSCGSLKRIAHIPQKDIKNQYLDETINFLNQYFPSYRKNHLIRHDKLSLYYRLLNKKTIKLYAWLICLKG